MLVVNTEHRMTKTLTDGDLWPWPLMSRLPLTFHNLWGLLWSLSFYWAFKCLPLTFHILWGRFWHFRHDTLEFPFLNFELSYLNSPGSLLTFHTWTSHICTARVSPSLISFQRFWKVKGECNMGGQGQRSPSIKFFVIMCSVYATYRYMLLIVYIYITHK